MRFATLPISLLLLPASFGYVLEPLKQSEELVRHDKRQFVGYLTQWLGSSSANKNERVDADCMIGRGGKVADPPGAASKRVVEPSPSKIDGAKRVKLRYGPYKVPGMNKTSIVGEEGMLWNYPDLSIEKPCTGECTIVGQQAGLEYPDGKNANIDTGLWLHHMVHFTSGPNRWDPTCYGKVSLPHVNVGSSPSRSERYFSSGNERTRIPFDVLGNDTYAGYHLTKADSFAFIIDLMNMNSEDKVVYMTMTYDYVEGPLPKGWKDVKAIWLDARQCGTSEISPPMQSGTFTVASKPWTPNFEGEVLGMAGHCHDGGVKVTVMHKPDEVTCVSKAGYGETTEYKNNHAVLRGSGEHTHGIAPEHISSMSHCLNLPTARLPVTRLARDQAWTVGALYDYDKHPGNKDSKGMQDEIMAIAIMYAGIEPGLPRPNNGRWLK